MSVASLQSHAFNPRRHNRALTDVLGGPLLSEAARP
jgi:hypothetical protein